MTPQIAFTSVSTPAPVPAPGPGPSPTSASAPAQSHFFKTRYPSACKECRRRKQKCSLTQPCTNCARRFPQPPCEYGVDKVKKSSYTPAPESNRNGSNTDWKYSHLDMDVVRDALVEVDEGLGVVTKQPWQASGQAVNGVSDATADSDPAFILRGQTPDEARLLRIRFRDTTGCLGGQDVIKLVQYILEARLKVANSIVKDEWLFDGDQLVRAASEARGPRVSVSKFDDEIRHLPMAPTRMNKELVRTHLQLMSRFKASLDGSPRPNNRFMKHWVPFSIQDPLVLHVVLCSTASFLNETGRVPKTMLYLHRQTVMRMLNDQLANSHLCTNDSVMLAVAQMILTSWYWGSTEELHAHMAGFKRMIELRGGIQNLGMEGYTSKVALIDDFVIALAHETEPLMFGKPGFDFHDPCRVPLQVSFNSPLLFDCPPFLSPAAPLRLHPHTAKILDDMRTVIKAVVELSDKPTDEELDNLYSTAMSVLSAVTHLPANVSLDGRSEEGKAGDEAESSKAAGSKRKRQSDDTSGPRKAGTGETDERETTPEDSPDLVHRCVQKTALVYCYAIIHRVPTSSVCSEADFAQIWGWAWAIGLGRWAALSGVFAWMMICIVASSHQSVHGRMTKTLLVTAFMYIGTENWHVAVDMAHAALKLQRWLRGGGSSLADGEISRAFGGEQVIERCGFAFASNDFKESLPDGYSQTMQADSEAAG